MNGIREMASPPLLPNLEFSLVPSLFISITIEAGHDTVLILQWSSGLHGTRLVTVFVHSRFPESILIPQQIIGIVIVNICALLGDF